MDIYTEKLNGKYYCPECKKYTSLKLLIFKNKDGDFGRINLVCQECSAKLADMVSQPEIVSEVKKLVDVVETYADDNNWELIEEYGKYGSYSMTIWHPFGYENGWDLAQSALDDCLFAQDTELE